MKESRCIVLVSSRSVHISYILGGISDGEPWYYGRIPIRTWVGLPSSHARRKSGQIFILRKNESGHDRPVFDLASKLDVRGPGVLDVATQIVWVGDECGKREGTEA